MLGVESCFRISLNYFCVCWSLGYDVKEVGVMVADVSDESSLNAMCSSAKIVLNCVGPVCTCSVGLLVQCN